MTTDLRHQAEILLADLAQRFPMSYRPHIVWKAMRVSAGMAYYQKHAIGLSTRVIDDPDKLRSTLIHEYAHLLAYDRHDAKGAGHGHIWQQTMREMGAEPIVRHRYEVDRNQARQRVTYQCAKCGAVFERSRRLPKRRRYVHARCGGGLKLRSVEEITKEPALT